MKHLHTYMASLKDIVRQTSRGARRLAAPLLIASLTLASCNSKEESEEPKYEPAPTVAVNSFKLTADARVMPNLDSVYFSIDLNRGIIFNADSLPKGTAITRLTPVITFPSTVTSATIVMEGGSHREGSVDYKKSPTDTIDFSGNVKLILATEDDALTRTYTIKINVHKAVADSLMWDRMADTPLPSRLSAPKNQKTVALGKRSFTLVEESDASLTMSVCDDLKTGKWTKHALSLPFKPQIRTLAASDDALYILDNDGRLFTSTDGLSWSDTATAWSRILGGYGKRLLGLKADGSRTLHDIYPRPEGFTPSEIASDFPTDDYSNMLGFSSKWADNPYAYISGGRRGDTLLSATWAFDGSDWAKISNAPLPPLREALMVPYFVYRKTSTSWIQTEYSVTLCIGGRDKAGKLSRKVYLSYDNGVNWSEAGQLMQLPDFLPSLSGADAIISSTPMEAPLLNWEQHLTARPEGCRVKYFTDGSEVNWECPYIYLFGGIKSDGRLNDAVWRAVLARLTFAPLF